MHELKPGLNICHMNARSLVNKRVETKIMTLKHNIDILAVSENMVYNHNDSK